MGTLKDAIRKLRSVNQPVPEPMRLPTEAEVAAAEAKLGLRFHPDFREYLLSASDVVYGDKEPVTIIGGGHTDLLTVAEDAWAMGLPRDYLPICDDNGDCFAIASNGEVIYWSHNGTTDEKWPTLADWIDEVWLECR